MTLPYVRETITDGALGAAVDNPDDVVALIGASSSGTAATVYALTQPQDVRSTLGYGPLAEQAAHVLTKGRGKLTALCVPATTSAGSVGAFSKVVDGTGSGNGTVADSSSTPNDDYELRIKITTGGAVATAKFQYSLDNGRTWSGIIATAATYAIPNTGITVAFSGTSFDAGDVFASRVLAPSFDATALGAALDALFLDGRRFRLVHVVGIPASAAAAFTMASALDAKLVAAEALYLYARGICEGPEGVTDANLIAACTETLKRTAIAADFCALMGDLTLRRTKRPAAWPIVARIMQRPVHEHPGQFDVGSLEGVAPLGSTTSDAVSYSYRDEGRTPGLDDAGFMTLRTMRGVSGVYISRGTMLVSPTSDYRQLQNGAVMDKAATAGHDAMLVYLNRAIRTNANGTIKEEVAQQIEREATAKLERAIVNAGHAERVELLVLRTNNVLSTKELKYRVRVLPFGYAEFIDGEYGFVNPALAVA